MDAFEKDDKVFEESTYIWILHNLTELRNEHGNGVCLKSPEFPDNDNKYKWQLCMFPNGTKSTKNRFSLFLKQPRDYPVFAKFTLCIRNSSDEVISENKLSHHFSIQHPDWGLKSALLPEKLTSSFSDDIIKIHVVVLAEVFILRYTHKVVMHQNNSRMEVLSHFESMFQNEEFSDFVIKFSDSSEKKVHRNILSARSPVFSAMFKHDTSENQLGYTEITDVNKDTMLQLLHFIYTGKSNNITAEEAQKLLPAADKYEILDLKRICVDVLKRGLRLYNVLEVLMLAEFHNVPELKNYVFDYILKHAWKFSIPDMLKNVVDKCPDLFAELVAKLVKNKKIKKRIIIKNNDIQLHF